MDLHTSDLPSYPFGPEFQRKILALAIRSDLLVSVPGAFRPEAFAPPGGGPARSPRQRIAELVAQFAARHAGERPGEATMEEMVREACARLPEAEAEAVRAEWARIRATEVPDPSYVRERVARWAAETLTLRELVLAGTEVQRALDTGTPANLHGLVARIQAAASIADGTAPVRHGSGARAGYWLMQGEEYWFADERRRRIGTGLELLDHGLRGGAQSGDLFFVVAPPKGGKSALLLQIAYGASRQGKGVAWFSMEMGFRAMLQRLDRRLLRRDRAQVMQDLGQLRRAKDGMLAMGAGAVWVEEASPARVGCAEIASRVRMLRGEGTEIDVVVIDYLNIMLQHGGTGRQEYRHRLTQISREMKDLARELDVVVWSAALCNRKATDKDVLFKTDIAEAYEVIAVLDGAIGICGGPLTRRLGRRHLYLMSMRDAEDEKWVGTYEVDFDRMQFRLVPDAIDPAGTAEPGAGEADDAPF